MQRRLRPRHRVLELMAEPERLDGARVPDAIREGLPRAPRIHERGERRERLERDEPRPLAPARVQRAFLARGAKAEVLQGRRLDPIEDAHPEGDLAEGLIARHVDDEGQRARAERHGSARVRHQGCRAPRNCRVSARSWLSFAAKPGETCNAFKASPRAWTCVVSFEAESVALEKSSAIVSSPSSRRIVSGPCGPVAPGSAGGFGRSAYCRMRSASAGVIEPPPSYTLRATSALWRAISASTGAPKASDARNVGRPSSWARAASLSISAVASAAASFWSAMTLR